MSSAEAATANENLSVIRPKLKILQQRAPRVRSADVPWISAVRLPWGVDMCLLNISTTGILVETPTKFAPGVATELQLLGPDTSLAVPVRFVRSEVMAVDGLGVRYHAAAKFEKELKLVGPNESDPEGCATVAGLADWLQQLSTALKAGADCSMLLERIDQGLRSLAGVRDVRIGEALIAPQEGCESVCFTVAKGRAPSVLQAMFEPGQVPSDLGFKLLKAGAALAAVVLTLRDDSRESDLPALKSCSA